jgi:S1-C subfamily serine protease
MFRTSARLMSITAASLLTLALVGRAAAEERNAKELYKQTLRSTGMVLTAKGSGTGWVIDREKKLLITNHHVVSPDGKAVADEVLVLFPDYQKDRVVLQIEAYFEAPGKPKGRPVRGKVVDSDARRDLAVIQLEELPPSMGELKLAADSPEPGDRLHSIGNPGVSRGLWVYTPGVVRTVVQRQITYKGGQTVHARVIETTSPINPGDSGGPVVNDAGELVGVTSGQLVPDEKNFVSLMSFCIDVSEVRTFLEDTRSFVNPTTAEELRKRGHYYLGKRRAALALADFDAAIKAEPKNADAYYGRGQAHKRGQAFEKALADYNQAIKLNPKSADAYSSLAWLLATCEKTELRDGARAVEAALKACELTNHKNANHLDTLAAAYAATGQLDKAIKTESQAVKLASGERQEYYRSRLETYQKRAK